MSNRAVERRMSLMKAKGQIRDTNSSGQHNGPSPQQMQQQQIQIQQQQLRQQQLRQQQMMQNPPMQIQNPPMQIQNPPMQIQNPPMQIQNPPMQIQPSAQLQPSLQTQVIAMTQPLVDRIDLVESQFESNRKMVFALRAENAELKDMIVQLQLFTSSLHKLLNSTLDQYQSCQFPVVSHTPAEVPSPHKEIATAGEEPNFEMHAVRQEEPFIQDIPIEYDNPLEYEHKEE